MNVVAGGGLHIKHQPKTRHVKRKGYSANRVRYDKRRRLSARDSTTLEYMQLLAGDVCSFCGAHPDGKVSDRDHIVPLSAGGQDRWTNMTAACASCNRGRRNTPILHFLLKRNG